MTNSENTQLSTEEIDAHPVIVCSACHQASCWQGTLMCESGRGAGIVELCVGDLVVLELEHPTYWFRCPNTGAVDKAAFARFREKYPEEVTEEPPELDGECYRGGEYESAMAESQARIQRELK